MYQLFQQQIALALCFCLSSTCACQQSLRYLNPSRHTTLLRRPNVKMTLLQRTFKLFKRIWNNANVFCINFIQSYLKHVLWPTLNWNIICRLVCFHYEFLLINLFQFQTFCLASHLLPPSTVVHQQLWFNTNQPIITNKTCLLYTSPSPRDS